MPHNIIIVDDHEVILNGIIGMLEHDSFNFQTANTLSKLDLKLNKSTDIILLDVNIGKVNSINSIPDLRARFPQLKVILFTSYNSPALRREAAAAGAHAFLTKGANKEKLLETITEVLAKPVDNQLYQCGQLKKKSVTPDFFMTEGILSDRQLEILKMVAHGNTSQQIAELLFVSKHTVQWHRKNILAKLNLKSVAEMIQYAYEKGLV